MSQGDGIKVWAQMFFEDGTVSQGIRIPAEWLDDHCESFRKDTVKKLLTPLNREEGFILFWGAGNLFFYKVFYKEKELKMIITTFFCR